MRIVSLIPSGTEIICALGYTHGLVGISHECDYPLGVQHLPRVTHSFLDEGLSPLEIDAAVATAGLEQRPLYGVDGTLLQALKPDLILTQGVCAVCAVTRDTVTQSLACATVDSILPAASIVSLDGGTMSDVFADIGEVGRRLGVSNRADSLVKSLRIAWPSSLMADAARPRVAMLEWPDPLWYAGHWVPEQVYAAGGVDVFGHAGQASGRLSVDALIEADPDVCIMMGCGLNLEQNERHMKRLMAKPALRTLRCVQNRQVWALDANGYFSRPGPRLVDGAVVLAAILSGKTVASDRAKQCL